MTDTAQDAGEQFVRDWSAAQTAVASYIAALVPDFRDAQDLLQNVAVIAHRKFGEFDDRRSFIGWVLGIARLEILAHRRRFARSLPLAEAGIPELLAGAVEDLSDELERRARSLADCLKSLDGRAAELVRLRYEEALKPAAIAQRLGLGDVAVRVALSRIRASLRQCIEQRMNPRPL